MDIARVIGSAVSTVKPESLRGRKLLVVVNCDPSDNVTGQPYVAVDAVGAGHGELVLVARGGGARRTDGNLDAPLDAVIMAILDSLEVDGETTFRKA